MYNRLKAVEYAYKWANSRNPRYYDFDSLGGDCTNFISQCLYAGCGVMNFSPETGWYYVSLNKRSAAWTSVKYLHNFIINNNGSGPFGVKLPLHYAQTGDVIQLSFDGESYRHSTLVTYIDSAQNPDSILIAAHTYNALNRPLNTYVYENARLIHIKGARK